MTSDSPPPSSAPRADATDCDWIDDLSDAQCMEIFWLYVEPPEPFLRSYPQQLLGQAMRYALHQVFAATEDD